MKYRAAALRFGHAVNAQDTKSVLHNRKDVGSVDMPAASRRDIVAV